ncbi:MAG TPA: heavy-metal-associated domain-containing protein [Fodinibius sp.]|nr:heavy-metal-associated domain-containing protein [Fodinibius sp.]
MNNQTEATLTIDNMACSGCADSVRQELTNITGVSAAEVDHEKGTAVVTYDEEQATEAHFKQAVEGAGYEFIGMKN